MLDKQRVKAFLANSQKGRLLIDTFPYKSMQLGLCQVMIIFRIKSHKLMMKVYESKDDYEETVNSLRVIQEVKLEELGLKRQKLYSLDQIQNPVNDQELTPEELLKDKTRENDILREEIANVIKLVRKFKFELTGDIYKDFYNKGMPVSHLID